MSSALRLLSLLLTACALHAQCTLPDLAPGALDRLTPERLVDTGHFLRAVPLLEPQAAADPHAAWLLSRAKAALGDLEGALTLAESSVAADDANVWYHVQLAAVEAQLAQHSTMLKQLSLARKAKKEVDRSLELAPTNALAQWGQMIYLFAAPALLGGDKAKAQAMAEQLSGEQPDPGRYYQARLALEMKDLPKAEQFLQQAIIANPLAFDSVTALADFYVEQKPDQVRAERWSCLAVHLDPTRAEAWALLARAKAMCACWPEAVEAAQRSEAINPDDLSPWYALAQGALAKGQQTDQAIAWLNRYLSKPPNADPESTTAAARQLLAKVVKDRR